MSRIFPAPPAGLTEHDLREISKKGYMLPGGGATTAFSSMAAAPAFVTSGGALSYTGGDFIYAFQGGTNSFWRTTILAAPLFRAWRSWMR